MLDIPQAAVKRQVDADDNDVHAWSSMHTYSLRTSFHVTAHTIQRIIFANRSPNSRKRQRTILVELKNASEAHTLARPAGTETSNSSTWLNAEHINTEQAALDLQVCIHFNCDCG